MIANPGNNQISNSIFQVFNSISTSHTPVDSIIIFQVLSPFSSSSSAVNSESRIQILYTYIIRILDILSIPNLSVNSGSIYLQNINNISICLQTLNHVTNNVIQIIIYQCKTNSATTRGSSSTSTCPQRRSHPSPIQLSSHKK